MYWYYDYDNNNNNYHLSSINYVLGSKLHDLYYSLYIMLTFHKALSLVCRWEYYSLARLNVSHTVAFTMNGKSGFSAHVSMDTKPVCFTTYPSPRYVGM